MNTYNDTIVDFFFLSETKYQPLDRDCYATVFLAKIDHSKQYIHKLQFESCEIKGKEEKKEDGQVDQEDPEEGKIINIDKINKTIIGLTTYEANIDENKVKKYVKFTQSHQDPNVSIWKLICAFILLMINIIGKQIKNNYSEEYFFRKVAETYFRMKYNTKGILKYED